MYEKDSIIDFIARAGKQLKKEINVYLIGGCNLSLKGMKVTTKDVDLALTDYESFDELKIALESLGFKADKSMLQEQVYRDAVIVFLDNTGSRIDIFVDKICSMLRLTGRMRKRAEKYGKFGKIELYLVSNEDIFLFKSLTGRPGDLIDLGMLMGRELDWDIIIDECVSQHTEDVKWVFWVYEQLCRFEESEKKPIPAKQRFFKVCTDNWQKKPKDWMYGFSEEQISKHIPAMYQSQVLKSLKKK